MLINPYLWLAICFCAGAAFGIVAEYMLHWLMHRWTSLGFHIGHHKEYFRMGAREPPTARCIRASMSSFSR